jgi:hypothetical protein
MVTSWFKGIFRLMNNYKRLKPSLTWGSVILFLMVCTLVATSLHAASPPPATASFPPSLETYGDAGASGLIDILRYRISMQPLNLWCSLLFLGAIVHTFFTQRFHHHAVILEQRHRLLHEPSGADGAPEAGTFTSGRARLFLFFGEVEVVFGLWVIPLLLLLTSQLGLNQALNYIEHGVNYDEVLFVVVIMAISATRPVLQLAEQCLAVFARLGGNGPAAWWFSILTIGPLLGSVITEPAAMTISALLLGRRFYALKPSSRFAYATLGLLFVNISVGGTLTNFAAPPVLMVASAWGWDTSYMLSHFGWIAVIGILISNTLYFLLFRKDFASFPSAAVAVETETDGLVSIPFWVTVIHLLFMASAVYNIHRPALLVGSFLFFLAFFEVTEDYQGPFQLRSPILVGFFLAGLVIHGGLQQWWIAPVLGGLSEVPLMLSAIGLTALNDNAAITYLSSLVPNLTESMKFAVMAGAVTGGGLTVIANAPNPAGQSILNDYFEDGISPSGLLLGALVPTTVMIACFLLLPILQN